MRRLDDEHLRPLPRRLETQNLNLGGLLQGNGLGQLSGGCFAGCPQIGLQLNLGNVLQMVVAPVITVTP